MARDFHYSQIGVRFPAEYVFFFKLAYNWHIVLCKFKEYMVLFWYIYAYVLHVIITVILANTFIISHIYNFFFVLRTVKI